MVVRSVALEEDGLFWLAFSPSGLAKTWLVCIGLEKDSIASCVS